MLSKDEWDSEKQNYYDKVSNRVSEDENIKKLIEGKKTTAAELVERSKELNIVLSNIEAVEKAARLVIYQDRITDGRIVSSLSGVRVFLEKGELLLLTLSEIVGTNEIFTKKEMYPLSVIQPIASAFEICVNLLFFKKTGRKYFEIKKDNSEVGKLLNEMEYRNLLTYTQHSILKKALLIRNKSAHTNLMYLADIESGPKNDIYNAIRLIEKIIR